MDTQPTKAQRITGIVLTALPGLLLLFSASGKLMLAPEVIEGFTKFGFDPGVIRPIGLIEALAALLFLIPRTSFLGAILVTGYMGGAICTHLRMGEPVFIQMAIGVVAWIGYGLRRPGVIKSAF